MIARAENTVQATLTAANAIAKKLRDARKRYANEFSLAITQALQEMDMPNAQFIAQLQEQSCIRGA